MNADAFVETTRAMTVGELKDVIEQFNRAVVNGERKDTGTRLVQLFAFSRLSNRSLPQLLDNTVVDAYVQHLGQLVLDKAERRTTRLLAACILSELAERQPALLLFASKTVVA